MQGNSGQGNTGRLLAGAQRPFEIWNPAAHCFALSSGPDRGRTSPDEVDVCGVYRPRERNLPLEGENDDDRKNDEPGREQPRRKGRAWLKYAGRTSHRRLSVPTSICVVKLYKV
jgi:hypothetical protein